MNIRLETKRLIILPLTAGQIHKYLKLDNSLEAELNLNKSSRTISPELKEALEETILPNVLDTSKNYLFSTLWTVILKEDNKMVADLCFVGEPNLMGEIEIGYGTYDSYRNKGYMTEAVSGMIQWAQTQSNVKSIIASTEKSNIASFAVLEKNNFIKYGETETLFHWHIITNISYTES